MMREYLEFVAKQLVDEPDAVRVGGGQRDGALVLKLHVAKDDVGKVIGRQGRIARALRTVVRAGAMRRGRRTLVEIVDNGAVRVAALYDVHGMLAALEAVLAELEHEDLDGVVLGGDVVGGPQPAETLARLRELELPQHWLRGNGERALGSTAVARPAPATPRVQRGKAARRRLRASGGTP
jgi:predicted RNA-binding protein YlqC (UPF0109 family)